MSDEKQHLVFAILRYFEQELLNSELQPDAKETLEVASQCLETVYKLSASDGECKRKYPLPASLPEIFKAGLKIKTEEGMKKEVSPEQKERAEKFKSEGNTMMKEEKFQEAIDCYGKAIEIDNTNAVYYCNRAAAYSKLSKYEEALADCEKALEIDANYSKAFGRKGLAHSALNQHKQAHSAFEKALELDPTNDSFKKNLEVAEQKLSEQAANAGFSQGLGSGMPAGMGMPGGLGMPGGMDIASLMNNPALMQMATQMMSNPQMQEMMGNMLSSFRDTAPQNESGGVRDMAGLLHAGHQMAQQFQEQNPDIVDQLRNQVGSNPDGSEKEQKPPGNPEGDGPTS